MNEPVRGSAFRLPVLRVAREDSGSGVGADTSVDDRPRPPAKEAPEAIEGPYGDAPSPLELELDEDGVALEVAADPSFVRLVSGGDADVGLPRVVVLVGRSEARETLTITASSASSPSPPTPPPPPPPPDAPPAAPVGMCCIDWLPSEPAQNDGIWLWIRRTRTSFPDRRRKLGAPRELSFRSAMRAAAGPFSRYSSFRYASCAFSAASARRPARRTRRIARARRCRAKDTSKVESSNWILAAGSSIDRNPRTSDPSGDEDDEDKEGKGEEEDEEADEEEEDGKGGAAEVVFVDDARSCRSRRRSQARTRSRCRFVWRHPSTSKVPASWRASVPRFREWSTMRNTIPGPVHVVDCSSAFARRDIVAISGFPPPEWRRDGDSDPEPSGDADGDEGDAVGPKML